VIVLLDTHVFLWWSTGSTHLKAAVRRAIAEADDVYVSAASAWEVAIKMSLGKLRMDVTFDEAVSANGFSQLPITFQHAAAAGALPSHHADPFDHMLIAQAQVEAWTLVSHDRRFAAYDVRMLWV
jgi:PIN domain nuclease of toxin-antitoxin system